MSVYAAFMIIPYDILEQKKIAEAPKFKSQLVCDCLITARILTKSTSKSSEEQVSTIGDAAESSPQSHFNRSCV
jgi:hypothetical protein